MSHRLLGLAGLALALAGCAGAEPIRFESTAPEVRAAVADLTSFVRTGWHLPVRVRVLLSNAEDGRALAPVEEAREVALAVRQLAAVREAQARAAFDFFAVSVEVGAASEPSARCTGDDRRLEVRLPAPGAGPVEIVEAPALLEALGEAFAWDAVGPWYRGETTAELVAALRRDVAKLDRLEDGLQLDCRRLEMLAASLEARGEARGEPPLLTPSEATFARGAQFRATFALHRVLNTIARWRAAGEDEDLSVRRAAVAVLARARTIHQAYLDWLLHAVVGERPVLAVWEDDWWHRRPLYKVLDAQAPLDFVDLDGAPPGAIPAGSVRALLRLRYDGDLDDCYGTIDDLSEDVPGADPALADLSARLAERQAATRVVLEERRFGEFAAWKETWDARLKNGFSFPFYAVVATVSTFLGDTRTTSRPPALRGERLARLAATLRPGDILLVRQDGFLSNVFLPGFWPHALLWLGEADDWTRLSLGDDRVLADDPIVRAVLPRYAAPADEHGNPARVLEATSDGVVFSSIEHALAKDYVVALRPTLPEPTVAGALRRALACLGRPYDFSFDFATDDRVVCTELVYRAYNPELNFRVQHDAPPPPPAPRVPGVVPVMGRLTMPANEVARYALHMADHPEPAPGLRYPGRRLEVLFFVDRDGEAPVVHEGPAALEAFRATVDR